MLRNTNNQTRQIICLFMVSRYNFHCYISGSSNLLVDKIKSVVALRILELLLGLSDVFPKFKVCVRTLLVFSNKLQLRLLKVIRRIKFSLTNWGQWMIKYSVDSTPFPQLHSRFNIMKMDFSGVMKIVKSWSYELKNIAFKHRKVLRFSKMRMRVVPFNYSWWKKRDFEKAFFVLTREISCVFRAKYNEGLVGIKLNRYLGFLFSKTLWKKGKAFYTSVNLEGSPISIIDRFFPWLTFYCSC